MKCYTTWSEFLQAPVHKLYGIIIYHSPLYVVVWPFLDIWHNLFEFQVKSFSVLFVYNTNLTWFIVCHWIEFTVSHHYLVLKKLLICMFTIWLYKWQCMVWQLFSAKIILHSKFIVFIKWATSPHKHFTQVHCSVFSLINFHSERTDGK